MVAVKMSVYRWQRDVGNILKKPGLMVAIITIGFFMLWLASEQVEVTLQFLVHFRLAEPHHTERLTDRYFLLGLFILAYLWLDLMLLNLAFTLLGSAFTFFENYLAASRQEETLLKTRKNPVRECRSRNWKR